MTSPIRLTGPLASLRPLCSQALTHMPSSITPHRSILCVSNDASLLESRRLLLQRAGYTVLTMTGSEISVLWDLPPCELVLICQSVGEPERSRLLVKLRERGNLPYILMHPLFGDPEACSSVGITYASHRPEDLLRCVGDLLQQRAAQSTTCEPRLG